MTGTAMGGSGDGEGPGGNAYSGYSGPSRGGNVFNSAGTVDNTAMASEYPSLRRQDFGILILLLSSRHRWKWRLQRDWRCYWW